MKKVVKHKNWRRYWLWIVIISGFFGGLYSLFFLALDKFEIIDCFRGTEECRLKADLYEYQNAHKYVSYGKKVVTKLDNNSSLRPCDSYKIRFNFKKTRLWWNSWSTIKNDYIYIFRADVDGKITDSIYNIKLLFDDSISFSKGYLSLPKEGEYFSLQDSELGKKEIYLLDFEGIDEKLEKEYKALSDGGKKDIFYKEYLKQPNGPSFSFELKEDGTCPPVKVDVKYQYKVEDSKCWPVNFEVYYEYMDRDYNKHELTSKSKLGYNDSYRIIITKKQDAYISILQKDHVTNECHLLYLNSSDKIRDGINYIPNSLEYFTFQKSEQRGAKTIFVRATSCLEDYPKLQDCPPQNKCTDDCVSSQTFYFE
jgi:hypothetical protein